MSLRLSLPLSGLCLVLACLLPGCPEGSGDCTPTDEVCDGVDNDCDGETDEGVSLGDLADVQAGVCAGARKVCFGGAPVEPDYADLTGYEADEVSCDGLDNDCDGETDADLVITTPADLQAGVCAGATKVCAGGGPAEPDYALIAGYSTADDSCDGVDNDCDGQTDEEWVAVAADLQEGVCVGATKVCVAGGPAEPDYTAIAGYATDDGSCDGIDNDCDGQTDEDWVAVPADRQDGVCAGAVKVCTAGGPAEPDYTALTGFEASEASCDGLDNDCDGTTDGPVVLGNAAACAASSCEEIARVRGGAAEGTYWIDPTGSAPMEVDCDPTTDGGGWTVLFDVCADGTASLEQPLDSTLGALPVGRVQVTTVTGETRVIDWMDTEQQTVADLYADPFQVPTAGVTYRTKRLGERLELFDDGDCGSLAGTVQCTNLFAANNLWDATYGHDYGCRDGDTCRDWAVTISPIYGEAVCKLAVRSTDFQALSPEASCLDHLLAGRAVDGVYTLDVDGAGGYEPFPVWCDMTIDGGGWTLITSMNAYADVTVVDSTSLVTPHSSNVTNTTSRLAGVTEVLLVTDGRDEGFMEAYDKVEKVSGVSGLSLEWSQILSALTDGDGGSWADNGYSVGVDDAWEFTAERLNTEGCLQTALRGSYGDGNYGGFNGSGYSPAGSFYYHWGAEIWMVGHYGTVQYAGDLRCQDQLRAFTRFWKGTYLR